MKTQDSLVKRSRGELTGFRPSGFPIICLKLVEIVFTALQVLQVESDGSSVENPKIFTFIP